LEPLSDDLYDPKQLLEDDDDSPSGRFRAMIQDGGLLVGSLVEMDSLRDAMEAITEMDEASLKRALIMAIAAIHGGLEKVSPEAHAEWQVRGFLRDQEPPTS
jgi:hypothetical protein